MTRAAVLAGWAFLALGLCGCELAALAQRPPGVVGMGRLLRRVTGSLPVTGVLFVAWMWTGWHLFAR